MARPKKKKCENAYNLQDSEYHEILNLGNKELISRASLEYANWQAVESMKKEDASLQAVSSQIKAMEDAIKEHDEYLEIKDKLDTKFEELADESLCTYKEEKKNLMEPYKEDINRFKGCFKAAMDEVNRRKKEGLLVVEGKIV
jgi:DNA-binding FrmR family transcriptional regulator